MKYLSSKGVILNKLKMKKTIFLTLIVVLFSTVVSAQSFKFKELKHTNIKGASRLTAPGFVKTGDKLITAHKFGHAAPAIYDWDRDGKLDLLVGEFGSGLKSNVLVFKNKGKNNRPVYNSESYYAKDNIGVDLSVFGS